MAQLTLPIGKQEFHDGNNWYSLASENWVLNTLRRVSPCLVATIANLTATYVNGTSGVGATLTNADVQNILIIDGITLSVNDRVLVKNQTSALQNGIYIVTDVGSISTNWVLTRASDYDVIAQTIRGDTIAIINGTNNNSSLWMLTTIINSIGIDNFSFATIDRNSFTSIVGTTNQINVNIASGVATISISDNPVFTGTASATIPAGTTAERPVIPTLGMIRINTDL